MGRAKPRAPTRRSECRGGPRPCPWVRCADHLGDLPGVDLERESCSRDLSERGPVTLQEIGELLGISREYVRLIERRALVQLRRRGGTHLVELVGDDVRTPGRPAPLRRAARGEVGDVAPVAVSVEELEPEEGGATLPQDAPSFQNDATLDAGDDRQARGEGRGGRGELDEGRPDEPTPEGGGEKEGERQGDDEPERRRRGPRDEGHEGRLAV